MKRWLQVAILAALVVSGWRYVRHGWLEPWTQGGRDIGVDYCAARAWLRGGDMYDMADLRREQTRTHASMDRGGYIKPPLFAVLFSPLALLPYDVARRAWLVINHLLLVGVVALVGLLAFPAGRERAYGWLGLALLAMNAQPVYAHMLTGQTNLLVLLLICLALLAHERGWPVAAGIALGAATALKLYPATLIAYFLWRRQRQVVAGACAAMILWTCFMVLAVGFGANVRYVVDVLPTLLHHRPDVAHFSNQSIYACFHRLFVDNLYTDAVINSPARARIASMVCCTVLAAITVLLCVPRSGQVVAEASLVVIATTLIVSQAWDMNFVAMLVPAGVVLSWQAGAGRLRGWPAAAWVVAWGLVGARFGAWEGEGGMTRTAMLLCPRLVGALVMYGLVARGLGRPRG